MRKSNILVLILFVVAIIAGGSSIYTRPSYVPQDASRFSSNGHYYKLIHEQLTWDEAYERCIIMNGYLACITSQAENDFVLALAIQKDYPELTCCWLGSTDKKVESQWKWITGEPLVMEDNLLSHGGEVENYLNLRLATGEWEDYPVDGESVGEQWFVCEWD